MIDTQNMETYEAYDGGLPLQAPSQDVFDVYRGRELLKQLIEGMDTDDVYDRYLQEDLGPCPRGFICDGPREERCDEIRDRAKNTFFFGDIHAGAFCPGGSRDRVNYLNCDVGYYCPDPSTRIPCPAGFFCPHKTSAPKIKCRPCGEMSDSLVREDYGYWFVGVLLVLVVVVVIWIILKRYNTRLYQHISDLKQRRVDNAKLSQEKKKHQARLERIRPKLELIAKRLEPESFSSTAKLAPQDVKDPTRSVSVDKRGHITFDARLLFDEIDVDGSEDLSYEELNKILELNAAQLREFVRRMNELGGVPPGTETVTRPVFVKYFLRVLEETSHFGPATEEEVAELFDEIAAQQGTNSKGELEDSAFFESSLSDFLSDAQINDMIKRFKRLRVESERNPNFLSIRSNADGHGAGTVRAGGVRREDFIENYAMILMEVTTEPDALPLKSVRPGDTGLDAKVGIDISFQDLSLVVRVKDDSVNVVDSVTGRLRAGTLTALMGGSGAGKTSLLNALCGRAFYGEVTGAVQVNGHTASIEDHASAVGFVPQDDIVYAELTVRENFLYAGRFQLPAGTPFEDIEDLADATMANLGLSRVANSIVGDVTRRGVSGGEKKRVNIGLELMARPSILFLDEPTSGLDASSALLVMKSLKSLVENQGVTVCSVIHQPRKFIYDLFDSLILLGVGGKMVYHGPAKEAESYFNSLDYHLPPGESVADWLIDISSGRLDPSTTIAPSRAARDRVENKATEKGDNEIEVRRSSVRNPSEGLPSLLSSIMSPARQGADTSTSSEQHPVSDKVHSRSTQSSNALFGEDDDAVGVNGPSANKFEQAFLQAKARREKLYQNWDDHLKNLSESKKEQYDAPEPYLLPESRQKPGFFQQLRVQLHRQGVVGRRNWLNKLVDTIIIVGAVIVISLMSGVVEVTKSGRPDVSFDNLVSENPIDLAREFPNLFLFALRAVSGVSGILEYGLKLGVIISVLVGLTATKILTEKRLEFFREAGSGYNTNAYFLGVNIVSTIEHSIQTIFSAGCALWLRNSVASAGFFYLNFLMLAWLCVSWALFLPLLVPPKNVVLVVGFFMAFFSLLFSGGLEPVTYKDIYADGNSALAVFSGFVAPTRFFIESMAVAESRCLPIQTGFTDQGMFFPPFLTSFALLGFAQNDESVTERSCNGWYWGVLPSFLVGLTVRFAAAGTIHVSGRSQQAKKPLLHEVQAQLAARPRCGLNSILLKMLVFFAVLVLLFSLSCVFILREDEPDTFGVEDAIASQESKYLR